MSGRRFAVLGHPVSHSLSPLMHGAWIKAAGLQATYDRIDVGPDGASLGPALEQLDGANVTIPHKEAAAARATSAEPRVQRLGAANVLTRTAAGWAAANTDAPGFIAALDEAAPGWRAQTKAALVIGAGGAGVAILDGLAEAGLEHLVIVNRTLARAQDAAVKVPRARAAGWPALAEEFAAADLIVNATSLGLGGGGPDWPFYAAKRGAIAVDAVYKPLTTAFLSQAGGHGLKTVDGLGMLIHQGALAFEHWFGVRPDTQAARALLLAALKERSE
jgi:shikimate dehydrogenase